MRRHAAWTLAAWASVVSSQVLVTCASQLRTNAGTALEDTLEEEASVLFNTSLLARCIRTADGCSAGAARLAGLLAARRPIRFMGIGSSITGAHGGCTHGLNAGCPRMCGGDCYNSAAPGRGWLRKFCDWLERALPVHLDGHHEVYNGGKGGSHIGHFAHCLQQYMPRNSTGPVDVVILEVTIARCESAGEIELLLANLLLAKPPPAIILLRSFYSWGKIRCTEALQALARANHIPLLDLDVLADLDPSTSKDTTKGAVIRGGKLLIDSIHPNTRGQDALAALLGLGIAAMVRNCRDLDGQAPAAGLVGARHKHSRLVRGCYAFTGPNGGSDSSRRAFVGSHLLPPARVENVSGWFYVTHALDGTHPGDATAKRRKPKPGLVATEPGATATIVFDHTDASDAPFATVEYLRSYEHMGMANMACADGCECESVTVDAHYGRMRTSEHFSSTLKLLPISGSRGQQQSLLPAQCKIVVTVLNSTTSGEHKFKLTGLTVGGSERVDKQYSSLLRRQLTSMAPIHASSWQRGYSEVWGS